MASPLRLVRINHQMAMEVLPVARRRASADGELLPIFVNYGFIPYAKNTVIDSLASCLLTYCSRRIQSRGTSEHAA
eukprot:4280829-Pleurochrysis_carterae.AAC.1